MYQALRVKKTSQMMLLDLETGDAFEVEPIGQPAIAAAAPEKIKRRAIKKAKKIKVRRKMTGRRQVHPNPDMIKRVKKLSAGGISTNQIIKDTGIASSVFYKHYRQYCNKKMKVKVVHPKRGQSKWSRTGREAAVKVDRSVPRSSSAKIYGCSNCKGEFTSMLDIEDARCPKCKSKDLKVIE